MRRAYFIEPELLKGQGDSLDEKHHKDSFADQQAKRMMGAGNPLTGADNRAPASTYCTSCSRWHRPGVPCANKSFLDATLVKGRRIAVFHPASGSGNSFHDPRSGGFIQAPKSGGALADHHLAKLEHVVTRHNEENPEPAPAPSNPGTEPGGYGYQAPSYMDAQPQQQPSQAPQQVPTAQSLRPMDPPTTIHGVHTLLNYKPAPQEKQEPAKRLETASGYLQGQQQGYLNALRAWQAMHTGNQ